MVLNLTRSIERIILLCTEHVHSECDTVMVSVAMCMQATIAACNVAGVLQGYSPWGKPDMLPFVDGPFEDIPKAAPSIVNAKDVGL